MPIVEIRESIEQTTITLDSSGYAIVQKEINLKPGARHTMVQADLFQDAIIESNEPVSFEFYVSPYPIVYSTMKFSDTEFNRGPAAAVDTILFKSVMTPPDRDWET